MTYGKRQWERYDSQMRRIIPVMHEAMKELLSVIDADTNAFNDYMVRYHFDEFSIIQFYHEIIKFYFTLITCIL